MQKIRYTWKREDGKKFTAWISASHGSACDKIAVDYPFVKFPEYKGRFFLVEWVSAGPGRRG